MDDLTEYYEADMPRESLEKQWFLLHSSLLHYRDKRIPTGRCLHAFLTNDLRMFLTLATPETVRLAARIHRWCRNELPSKAWGNEERVNAWVDNEVPEAKCPRCETQASGDDVETLFGYRRMFVDGPLCVQSWCRRCRAEERRAKRLDEDSPYNMNRGCE